MTMSAVATTWLFILGYYALTGSHFFSPAALATARAGRGRGRRGR